MIKRLLILSFLLFSASLSFAQTAANINAITPLTRDTGAIVTMTSQTGPVSATSADQSGFNVSRVICVFSSSSSTGTAQVSFVIQNKDAVSAQYYTIATSATLAGTATQGRMTSSPLAAGAGVATGIVAGLSSSSLPIARTWRVAATVSSGTIVSGTVGCNIQ